MLASTAVVVAIGGTHLLELESGRFRQNYYYYCYYGYFLGTVALILAAEGAMVALQNLRMKMMQETMGACLGLPAKTHDAPWRGSPWSFVSYKLVGAGPKYR